MHRLIRYRPSPAMIVACIALIIALGGTSYAAITLPAGSVGTKQLKKNAVIGSKVKAGSLTIGDISAASLSKLSRVAWASSNTSPVTSDAALATVSLTVPQQGFVLVQGWVAASNASGQWGAYVRDDTAAVRGTWNNHVTATGTYSTSGNSWVFPVTAGAHTFSVRASLYTAAAGFNSYNTITAQFIPYDGTGSPTPPGTSAPAKQPAQAGQPR